MTEIIVGLQEEHRTMVRILDLLGREMQLFDGGEVADFHLVQEIMDYCLDFPEAFHHPKEDAIHAAMRVREPALDAEMADLAAAHERLGRQTRHAHETVERLMRDETMSRDLVAGVFGSFVDTYRRHIRLEEENFFPEALRVLTVDDWRDVSGVLISGTNPLTDRNAQRFATLRHGILRVTDAAAAP